MQTSSPRRAPSIGSYAEHDLRGLVVVILSTSANFSWWCQCRAKGRCVLAEFSPVLLRMLIPIFPKSLPCSTQLHWRRVQLEAVTQLGLILFRAIRYHLSEVLHRHDRQLLLTIRVDHPPASNPLQMKTIRGLCASTFQFPF